ncbi:hypothetical protein X772_13695 [Mesorhizobium sp. LSJC280B00]|nr:hypothetical protein X772_13695 [Mesorhizobium sp. LSJC280B00]
MEAMARNRRRGQDIHVDFNDGLDGLSGKANKNQSLRGFKLAMQYQMQYR